MATFPLERSQPAMPPPKESLMKDLLVLTDKRLDL